MSRVLIHDEKSSTGGHECQRETVAQEVLWQLPVAHTLNDLPLSPKGPA